MRLPTIALLITLVTPWLSAAEPTPAANHEALKKAAASILSCDCGNSVLDPEYTEQSKLLADAGATLIPVLTELVADPKLSPWFVAQASSKVSKFPFSQEFDSALRKRRVDAGFVSDPGAFLILIAYYADHGTADDLLWIEQRVSGMEQYRRDYAAKALDRFRERLKNKPVAR
jgi:hypothetical protein